MKNLKVFKSYVFSNTIYTCIQLFKYSISLRSNSIFLCWRYFTKSLSTKRFKKIKAKLNGYYFILYNFINSSLSISYIYLCKVKSKSNLIPFKILSYNIFNSSKSSSFFANIIFKIFILLITYDDFLAFFKNYLQKYYSNLFCLSYRSKSNYKVLPIIWSFLLVIYIISIN